MEQFKNIMIISSLTLFLSPLVHAQSEDYSDYDDIVKDLSSGASRTAVATDPFDEIMIHGGLGFTSTYVNVHPQGKPGSSGLLTGIEASLGIDLLSREWLAEGAVRSFGTDHLSGQSQASLREFDLKLIYRSYLSSKFIFRIGGGLAARYLKYSDPINFAGTLQQTTPSWIALMGFEIPVAKALSAGFEVTLRTPMISDTIDRTAVDSGFRVSAHF